MQHETDNLGCELRNTNEVISSLSRAELCRFFFFLCARLNLELAGSLRLVGGSRVTQSFSFLVFVPAMRLMAFRHCMQRNSGDNAGRANLDARKRERIYGTYAGRPKPLQERAIGEGEGVELAAARSGISVPLRVTCVVNKTGRFFPRALSSLTRSGQPPRSGVMSCIARQTQGTMMLLRLRVVRQRLDLARFLLVPVAARF
jgi:hypothetical protein